MASLPYPRCPPNSFRRTHSKFVYASPPTDFTEFTEVSGGGYSPTDFTDAHRCRRVWHPCHTHAALQIPSTEPFPSLFAQVLPQNSQKLQAEGILPRISQNTQKLLAEKSLPQMRTDVHRWLGCVGFCGKIVLWLRGYGRMPYPPNLCISVQSVGEYLAPETSVGSVASVGR